MKMYRQGDVMIRLVEEIPTGAKERKAVKGRHVLAEGEATGHAHVIRSKGVHAFDFDSRGYLRVERSAVVEHEEHSAITLEPGIYEVIRQREYSPEAIRNVAD